MGTGEIGLLIGALAGLAFLARQWRAAEARALGLQSEIESLEEERKDLRAHLSKETQGRKRHSEELATLRNKADKAKRRQTKTPDSPLGTTARIRDHEVLVGRLSLERDRARADCAALVDQVAMLETRLASSARALEEALIPPVPPDASELEVALERATADGAASRDALRKLEGELELARQTETRMRKRMSNQEQLYASILAELDVKKDRLRTQEEQILRLRSLKAAVID